MSELLGLCVYCERSIAEIIAAGEAADYHTALHRAIVADSRITLCKECLTRFAPAGADDLQRIVQAIITFPPGVTAIEHHCPELEARGLADPDCEMTLTFTRAGSYFVGVCPHCGVRVRSLGEDA